MGSFFCNNHFGSRNFRQDSRIGSSSSPASTTPSRLGISTRLPFLVGAGPNFVTRLLFLGWLVVVVHVFLVFKRQGNQEYFVRPSNLSSGISRSWRSMSSQQVAMIKMTRRWADAASLARGGFRGDCNYPKRSLFAMAYPPALTSQNRRRLRHHDPSSKPWFCEISRIPSSSMALNQIPKRSSFISIDELNRSGQQRTYKTLGDDSWGDYSDEGAFGPANYDPSEWEEEEDLFESESNDGQPEEDDTQSDDDDDEIHGIAEMKIEEDNHPAMKAQPSTSTSNRKATPRKDEPENDPIGTNNQRRPEMTNAASSPQTNFPSIAEVIRRPKSAEEAIPRTHYHAALGPRPIKSDDEEDESTSSNRPARNIQSMRPPPPSSGSYGSGSSYASPEDRCLELQLELDKIQKEILVLQGDQKFNINSPKQVSQALFGFPDRPTNKEVLEGMAAHNTMAKLVLQYRQTKGSLSKMQKRVENRRSGKHVPSVYSPKLLKKPQQQIQEGSNQLQPSSATGNTAVSTSNTSNDQLENDYTHADPLLLVDTSAYIFRAYYSMPPLHRSDGMPVGAVLGFCNMLNRLVLNRLLDYDGDENGERQRKLPRLVLVMDAPGKTIRHEMYPDYKANRAEAPMDLIPQFGLIRRAAEAYGIAQVQAYTYEADDVIATLATMALDSELQDDTVIILSSDKDLMQLVTRPPTDAKTVSVDDPTNTLPLSSTLVQMMDPMTMTLVDHDAVIEKWGVNASQVGDVLALAGDSADNIPGVPGIGPKTAATLISSFGSLDEIYKNLDQIPQAGRRTKLELNEEIARLSRRLVELERNVPLGQIVFAENDEPVAPSGTLSLMDDLRLKPIDPKRILDFYDEMGFDTIKRRLQQRLKQREQRLQRRSQKQGQQWQKETHIVSDTEGYKSDNSNESSQPRKKFKPRETRIPRPEDYKDVPF